MLLSSAEAKPEEAAVRQFGKLWTTVGHFRYSVRQRRIEEKRT